MRERLLPAAFGIVLVGIVSFLMISKIRQASSGSVQGPVKVEGRRLLTDFDRDGHYQEHFIKGVAYSPIPIGRHTSDWGWSKPFEGMIHNMFDDERILRRDFQLLQEMGCNAIRIWKANSTFNPQDGRFPNHLTSKTLDLAQEYGLKVIPGFWIATEAPKCHNGRKIFKNPDFADPAVRENHKTQFRQFVEQFKNHPAILFWAIGNENNYHLNKDDAQQVLAFYSLVNEMADVAHQAEGPSFHPVAMVNGDVEDIGRLAYGTTDAAMNHLDIWGANIYRGKTFGKLFDDFATRSEKPLWVAEYGIDAWVSTDIQFPEQGAENQETQARWVGALWEEIVKNHEVTIGGTVMEYSDEWWKPNEWIQQGARNGVQDHFGDGPQDLDCDGRVEWYPAAPDNFFHQEWFGIVAIAPAEPGVDRVIPRKAYHVLREKFKNTP